MIIRKLKCDQFAGIHDKDISLSDGMNIIVGKNETGKSTIVDLMYQTLFQTPKVARNKPFHELYFPKKATGIRGDIVDGDLTFETPDGTYRLKKEWEIGGGTIRLTLPDGTIIKDEDEINRIVSSKLSYGQGVYDEMVFPSQKRETTVLQSLFKTSDDQKKTADESVRTKHEISSIITRAVMETGGISINTLEKKLKEKLLQYDEQWNFESDMPEGGVKRGINNKWACATSIKAVQNNTARILRAYYDKEETAEHLRKALKAEKEIDDAYERLKIAKQNHQNASDNKDQFLKFKGILKNRELISRNLESEKGKKLDLEHDLENWPSVQKKRDDAQALQKLQQQSKVKDLYEKVRLLKDQLSKIQNEVDKTGEISQEDIADASLLERKILEYSASLKGMNLTAKIRKLGDIPFSVKSSVDGREISVDDDTFKITEAVDILVPDVFELQIMPDGIDAEAVSKDLEECRNRYEAIREKYSVENLDELKEKKSFRDRALKDVEEIHKKIDQMLEGNSWDSLETSYSQLPETVPSAIETENSIRLLCGSSTIDAYIGLQQGIINTYTEKYQTVENLASAIEECDRNIDKYTKEQEAYEDIPEGYEYITDADMYESMLNGEVIRLNVEMENIKDELTAKQQTAESHTAEEYQEMLDEKEEFFEKQKEEYVHWKHVAQTVQEQKKLIQTNPMKDIEEKFNSYLNVMTDGKVALTSINDKLDASLISGNNQLNYEILSEGTKDTISLAFRLAILEHLFPDGGGLAVFDDPFTDMDPDRKQYACNLLKEYVKKNQVVFVTCDEDYAQKLEGNIIKIEKQ